MARRRARRRRGGRGRGGEETRVVRAVSRHEDVRGRVPRARGDVFQDRAAGRGGGGGVGAEGGRGERADSKVVASCRVAPPPRLVAPFLAFSGACRSDRHCMRYQNESRGAEFRARSNPGSVTPRARALSSAAASSSLADPRRARTSLPASCPPRQRCDRVRRRRRRRPRRAPRATRSRRLVLSRARPPLPLTDAAVPRRRRRPKRRPRRG